MKNIYLIFIVACLAVQSKADVYNVKLAHVSGGDWSLAYVDVYGPAETIIVIYKDTYQGDMIVDVAFLNSTDDIIGELQLENPCNMDPSTEEGTLAAILWGVLGIKSCPISEGRYPLIENFNQTGIIENIFEDGNDMITVILQLTSPKDKLYFVLQTDVRLVEENT